MKQNELPVQVKDFGSGCIGPTVGLANIHARVPDVSANQRRIRDALVCFREHGVHLAVFPEFSLTGYFWKDQKSCRLYMESATLEHQREFIETSIRPVLDETLQFVVLNVLREADNRLCPQRFLNSTLVIGKKKNGDRIEAIYDKTFLPGVEKEYETGGKGQRLVLDTQWGRIGFLICYDLCFSALLQAYQFVDHVDAIVLQASWRGPAIRHFPVAGPKNIHYYGYLWDTLIPAQAALSQTWFFAANAVGRHNISKDLFWGGSGIWTPSGLPVLRASNNSEELIILRHIPVTAERQRERRDFDYSADFAAAGLSEPYRAEAVVVNAK
ncbi:MAG: carbon-nitrogen hydrolase family protein [Pseudomonadota bacterium]